MLEANRTFDTGLQDEADFSDLDLNENGWSLLIANINPSNTVNPRLRPRRDHHRRRRRNTATSTGRISDMKFAAWVQARSVPWLRR